LDKLIEGDTEAGEKLIDKAKQIDPKAVEELAEEGAPTPEARLLHSLQMQLSEARKLLG